MIDSTHKPKFHGQNILMPGRALFLKYGLFWAVVLVWIVSSGFSSGATRLYNKAVQFARAGQAHFAFMQYNTLLRDFPASPYRDRALFATGEYYFKLADHDAAEAAFRTFLDENPGSPARIYALAYLMSISVKESRPTEELRREIIDLQQVSFVFRESKEITYRSPLYQKHKAVIQIDKIEFYVEGDLFAKVAY